MPIPLIRHATSGADNGFQFFHSMSTAHVRWPLLYFCLPLSSLAGQPSMVSLPPDLTQMIPPCAHVCVESFVAEQFPISTCSFYPSLPCLCQSNSVSGFTLGEGSLRCLVSACSNNDQNDLYAAYEICQEVFNAQPMTHSTLTITLYSDTAPRESTRTSAMLSSSSSHQTSINTISSHSTIHTPTSSSQNTDNTYSMTFPVTLATGAPFPSQSTASVSSLNLPSSTPRSSTAASESSGSPATAIAAAQPVLTKPQIAGVSVAGVAAVATAFGIIIFLCCIRRRRSRRRDSDSSFGGDEIYESRPGSTGLYPTTGNITRDFAPLEAQHGQNNPVKTEGSPASLWRRRSAQHEEIGIAMDSEMMQRPIVNQSPMSIKSYRTTSRLLPDKPDLSLIPAPLRINHSLSPESPAGGVVPGVAGIGVRGATPLKRPAPRGRNSFNTSPHTLPSGFANVRPYASDPFLDSRSDPSASVYAHQGRQNPRTKVPNNYRPNPEILGQGQWTQSLENLPKPVPARQSSSARTLSRQKASISPSDYTGRPIFDLSTPPPLPTPLPRKPVPRRKSTPKRPPTHYSSASETSFEDAGNDDEEMPASHPLLSPVAESPAIISSRGKVTYPRAPGFATLHYERRPEPESPTPKPARRKQPPPLVTSGTNLKPLKSNLKPLPRVPENPESALLGVGRERGGQRPTQIITDSRNSPRGEVELRRTAKWKILVSPGLEGIESVGTPRSRSSPQWIPNTPTRMNVR